MKPTQKALSTTQKKEPGQKPRFLRRLPGHLSQTTIMIFVAFAIGVGAGLAATLLNAAGAASLLRG